MGNDSSNAVSLGNQNNNTRTNNISTTQYRRRHRPRTSTNYACLNDNALIKQFKDQEPIKAELLGSGSFKNAYNVKNDPSKVITQIKTTEHSYIKNKIKEVYSDISQHQKKNQTPNIIEVHDANLSQNQMLIQKLTPVQNMKLDNIQKMYAVRDTLKGLNQLHECGYVAHCDIKKENIGYDEKSKNFKILDLDSAIKCSPKKYQYQPHLCNGQYDLCGMSFSPETLQNEDKKVIGLSFCKKQVSQGCPSQDPENPTHYRKHLNQINQNVLKNDKISTIQSIQKVENIIVEAHEEKIQSLKTELKEQCQQELKLNAISAGLNIVKVAYNAYSKNNENAKTQVAKQAVKSGISIIGKFGQNKLRQSAFINSTLSSTEVLSNSQNFKKIPQMNISTQQKSIIMLGVKAGHSVINLMTQQGEIKSTDIKRQAQNCALAVGQYYVATKSLEWISKAIAKSNKIGKGVKDFLLSSSKKITNYAGNGVSSTVGMITTIGSKSSQAWNAAKSSLKGNALSSVIFCGVGIGFDMARGLSFADSATKNIKSSVGSVVGSAIGAAVGSVIPIIGTGIGSLVGGFLGSWFCS